MGSTPSSQAPAPPAALPNGPPAAPLVPGHDNPPILEGDFALLNMDVMIYLLKWFHPQAIRSFTGLSKNSKNLVHANALWKNLVEREYFNELKQFSTAASIQKHLKTQNWLELYRVLSIEERDWRKLPNFKGKPDNILTLTLTGGVRVGKTCFSTRFCLDQFCDAYQPSVGIEFAVAAMNSTTPVASYTKVHIRDISHTDRSIYMTRAYFRQAQCVLIFFDITNANTFKSVREIFADTRGVSTLEIVQFVLVGTKIDLAQEGITSRQVSFDEAAELAKELAVPYFEISSKSGQGVDEMVFKLCDVALRNNKITSQKDPTTPTTIIV